MRKFLEKCNLSKGKKKMEKNLSSPISVKEINIFNLQFCTRKIQVTDGFTSEFYQYLSEK